MVQAFLLVMRRHGDCGPVGDRPLRVDVEWPAAVAGKNVARAAGARTAHEACAIRATWRNALARGLYEGSHEKAERAAGASREFFMPELKAPIPSKATGTALSLTATGTAFSAPNQLSRPSLQARAWDLEQCPELFAVRSQSAFEVSEAETHRRGRGDRQGQSA